VRKTGRGLHRKQQSLGYGQDTAEKYIRRVRAQGNLISRVDRRQIAPSEAALEVGRVSREGRLRPLRTLSSADVLFALMLAGPFTQ